MKLINLLQEIEKGNIKEGSKFKNNTRFKDGIVVYENDNLVFKDENVIMPISIITNLNTDFEEIKEDKKIEEFDVVGCNIEVEGTIIPTESLINDYIIDKINELVRAVNKIREGK